LPHALPSRSHRQHATTPALPSTAVPPISIEELRKEDELVNPSR
jgi:hypothetical protein